MNLTAKNNVETNKYALNFEVSAEKFNDAIMQVYKKEGKKMNIDGFRKGKAPLAFIEKVYGKEVFFEGAVDMLYREMVTNAIEKSELDVIAVSDFKVEEISKENGIKSVITVVVKPQIEVKDYKGLEMPKEEVTVSDDEVNAEIEKVRERNARIIEVTDRAAENGDTTVIDFEGFVDGVAFEGGKGESHELALGAGQFIPGFEEQIVGHNIGEEFDVNVTFPEEYHAENLKGKEAVFKVKLHEIKAKELPELDDEFVKDVSEFDTLAEYSADVKAGIEKHKNEHAESHAEGHLFDNLIEKIEGEIPDEMYEGEVDEIINQFAYRLQSQGLNLETYLKYTNMTTEEMRKTYRVQAEKQVKLRLALEKIAEIEGITSSDDEIAKEYEELAKQYSMEVEKIKGFITAENLSEDIVRRKAVDFVKENAVITAHENCDHK